MTSARSKIVPLEELDAVLTPLRNAKKKIVQCHGVFDLMHIGHIRHFEQAKTFGDILVVSVTADQYVNKGPHRPAFTELLRAEAIASLDSVDYVTVNHAASAVPAIKVVKPAAYVKGKDYQDRPKGSPGKLALEEQAVAEGGGELVFTDDIQFSSTTLLNKYFNQFPPDMNSYLEEFRSKYTADDVLDVLEKLRSLKVLVVGETIIDDYQYVEAIGKAGKEPVLVTKLQSGEQFAGGSLAIANHVAGFCDSVNLLTCLGTVNSYETFIRSRLKSNVSPTFVIQKDRPTIVKRRYLDHYLLQKLFEVYVMDDEEQPVDEETELLSQMKSLLSEADVVIVADYGHGMVSKKARELLCKESKFLSVNTQMNAGNRGFHTISRYPRADYISLSEGELRLEMRIREEDIRKLIHSLRERVDCPRVTITCGKRGIICFDAEKGFAEGPGFAQSFVDRIGSGDAVLSISSPVAALGVHPDIVAFMGNLAGAEAVKTVGHRSSLESQLFKRLITSLLK